MALLYLNYLTFKIPYAFRRFNPLFRGKISVKRGKGNSENSLWNSEPWTVKKQWNSENSVVKGTVKIPFLMYIYIYMAYVHRLTKTSFIVCWKMRFIQKLLFSNYKPYHLPNLKFIIYHHLSKEFAIVRPVLYYKASTLLYIIRVVLCYMTSSYFITMLQYFY